MSSVSKVMYRTAYYLQLRLVTWIENYTSNNIYGLLDLCADEVSEKLLRTADLLRVAELRTCSLDSQLHATMVSLAVMFQDILK